MIHFKQVKSECVLIEGELMVWWLAQVPDFEPANLLWHICVEFACTALLEAAVRRWVHCDHKGMVIFIDSTQVGCGIEIMLDWY